MFFLGFSVDWPPQWGESLYSLPSRVAHDFTSPFLQGLEVTKCWCEIRRKLEMRDLKTTDRHNRLATNMCSRHLSGSNKPKRFLSRLGFQVTQEVMEVVPHPPMSPERGDVRPRLVPLFVPDKQWVAPCHAAPLSGSPFELQPKCCLRIWKLDKAWFLFMYWRK